MTTKSAYDWVSYIEKAILDLDEIPILRQAQAFPWDIFTKEFSNLFKIPNLKVTPLKWAWHSSETLSENLGTDFTCLTFSVLPLQGKVSLLIPAMDTNSLVTWLTEKRGGDSSVMNSQFTGGLLAYTSAEVLHFLQPMPYFDGFLLRYISNAGAPETRSLTLDVQIDAYGESLTCRLILPEAFRKSWMTHFLEKPACLDKKNMNALKLSCALQAGQITRSQKEWKEIQLGDFIPVENCQVDPDTKTGSLYLTIGGKALFRVRIKDKGLKILEQPIYEEESMSMDDETDFSEGIPEGLEEQLPPKASKLQESSNPEEAFLDSADHSAGIGERNVPVKQEKPSLEKIEQVPFNISIELARFKMTCEKLLQLKPGNLLELNLQPENPVNLVANGKKIAQGELIRVGEVLGVRILNVG